MNNKRIIAWLLCVLGFVSSAAVQATDTATELSEQLPGLLNTLNEHRRNLEQATSRDLGISPAPKVLAMQNNEAGMRDPFSATPVISQRMNAGNLPQGGGLQFQRTDRHQQLPSLKVRGIISRQQDEAPLALLEVGDKTVHLVRTGDEISFDAGDPSQVIRIQAIKRLSVVVEVGSLRDVVVVR